MGRFDLGVVFVLCPLVSLLGYVVGSEQAIETSFIEAQKRGYAERYVDQETGSHGWRWVGERGAEESCPRDSCGCGNCECDSDSRCKGCDGSEKTEEG